MEAIQTDIWVRFQRLRNNNCVYVCADDAHGTAIMLSAEARQVTAETLIAETEERHKSDYNGFSISFDNFYSTHSDENKLLSETIYKTLEKNGHIKKRNIKQLFDPEKNLFLADRYVVGTCPKCHAEDQYGDNCEVCGSTYDPAELINARSSISGAEPILKDSEHFFFDLPQFKSMLQQWTRSGTLQEAVANKLSEWLDHDLKQWDISRDAPYFGFKIPNAPDKYFYVWLDAPIGYMASFKNFCSEQKYQFDEYWVRGKSDETELYHFIGKDIINFHTLFWPAMLHSAGYRMPTAVFAHGFLTVDGTKMSKSRGTFIKARDYLEHLDPEYLRYYLGAKLSSGIDDLDLNFEDFVFRVNSDLVGKIANIASRCAGFLTKNFDALLSEQLDNRTLISDLQSASDQVADFYEQREFNKAIRLVMSLADKVNQYINDKQPWVLAKNDPKSQNLHNILTTSLNAFRILIIYLKPVVPVMAEKVETFLSVRPLTWDDLNEVLLNKKINIFKPLLLRVEAKAIETLVLQSKSSEATANGTKIDSSISDEKPETKPEAEVIDLKHFQKIDLRVAEIIDAKHVSGADKLLELKLSLGLDEHGEERSRTIFSGIKSAYQPETLIGRLTVIIANLKSRKMKFGVSEGMVLAAGPGDKEIWLLQPDSGAKAGMRIT
jgi:methionyl-tRNA synthetase